jgi:hypothetical protein
LSHGLVYKDRAVSRKGVFMLRQKIMALAAMYLLAAAPVLAAPTFLTVPAPSPAVKGALAATDLAGAQKMIGKAGAFQGTVTQVYSPQDHPIMILDFAKDYKTALTAFVGPTDAGKFAGLAATVQGKQVLISGTFVVYKGRPEIVLTSPCQIKLVR